MEKEVCRSVWDLSNPTREDTFSRAMFYIAMHLIALKKKDPSLQLPDQLPADLVLSSTEGSVQ